MYYLQSRYYDPEIGRFLNADNYISTGWGLLGYNTFAYCNNSPIVMVDSCGWTPEMVDDDLDNRPDITDQENGGPTGMSSNGPSTPGNAPNGGSNGTSIGSGNSGNTTGSGQAPHKGDPGSTYTQVSSDGKGQIVSVTTYGDYGAPSTRIDYIGRDHKVGLPHMHIFTWRLYNGIVQPTGETIIPCLLK